MHNPLFQMIMMQKQFYSLSLIQYFLFFLYEGCYLMSIIVDIICLLLLPSASILHFNAIPKLLDSLMKRINIIRDQDQYLKLILN